MPDRFLAWIALLLAGCAIVPHGILQARLAADARPALLMEQFDTDQQVALDEARRAGRDLAPLMRGRDWPHYQPLIALADRARLPLQAADLPRSAMRPAVREGYASPAAGELQGLVLETEEISRDGVASAPPARTKKRAP